MILSKCAENFAAKHSILSHSFEMFCELNYNFVKICRNVCGENVDLFSKSRKFCDVNYKLASQLQRLWELNYNFVSSAETIVRWITVMSDCAEDFAAIYLILSQSTENYVRWITDLSDCAKNFVAKN